MEWTDFFFNNEKITQLADDTSFEQIKSSIKSAIGVSAIEKAIENPTTLSTAQKYACDINADGKVSQADLIKLNAYYGKFESGVRAFSRKKAWALRM